MTVTPLPSCTSPSSRTPFSTVMPRSAATSRRTASVSTWDRSSIRGYRESTWVVLSRTRGRVSVPTCHSTPVISCARATTRSSAPIASRCSCVRGCTTIARDSLVGAGKASITRTRAPWRTSSPAAASPTEPAPTTRTMSVSSPGMLGRSTAGATRRTCSVIALLLLDSGRGGRRPASVVMTAFPVVRWRGSRRQVRRRRGWGR